MRQKRIRLLVGPVDEGTAIAVGASSHQGGGSCSTNSRDAGHIRMEAESVPVKVEAYPPSSWLHLQFTRI